MTENNTNSTPPPAPDHDHDHDAGHAHDHDHDTDHGGHAHHHHVGGPLDYDALDPANKSLADALRVSFAVLKIVMIVLVVLFLFSGTRNVDQQHVAVRLLFGKLHGEPGRQVLAPGGPYFWPPEPIGRFILIPTSEQSVRLDKPFWFEQRPADEGKPLDEVIGSAGGLVPGKDGSLLTADHNIVHARFTVLFKVAAEDAADFVRRVGTIDRAQSFVRDAAEQAMVRSVAQVTADQYVRTGVDPDMVMKAAQDALRTMGSGITITGLTLDARTAPLRVRKDFQAVTSAESEKAKMIEEARSEATQTLNRAGGPNYRELLAAIDAYEQARRDDDHAKVADAAATIDQLFAPDSDVLGGQAKQMLAVANDYRHQITQKVSGEVKALLALLPQYEKNPRIARELEWAKVRASIFSGDNIEIFTLPSDPNKTIYLEINPDPELRKKREQERYRKQQEEAAKQQTQKP